MRIDWDFMTISLLFFLSEHPSPITLRASAVDVGFCLDALPPSLSMLLVTFVLLFIIFPFLCTSYFVLSEYLHLSSP